MCAFGGVDGSVLFGGEGEGIQIVLWDKEHSVFKLQRIEKTMKLKFSQLYLS